MIDIVTSVTLSLIVVLVQLMTYEHTSIRTVFHAPVCLSLQPLKSVLTVHEESVSSASTHDQYQDRSRTFM